MTTIEAILAGRTPELGVDLITSYRTLLGQAGYTRTQVDTDSSPDGSVKVRYGYSGGEWRVTTLPLGAEPWTIRFGWNEPLPSLEQLMAHTVERREADPAWSLDATREMPLRGVG